MKQILLTSIICSIVNLIGCKEEDHILYHQISQDFKDWIYYDVGSYWIYQDSSNSQLDSIIIDSSFIVKKYHDQISSHDSKYYYDFLYMSYKDNYYLLLSEHMISNSNVMRFYGNGSFYPYFDLSHNDIGFEIVWNNSDGIELGSRVFLNHFDHYEIFNNTFENVYEIQIQDYIQNLTINYFIAKHNGIIKKRVRDKLSVRTWNIRQWSVIQ